MTEEDRRRWDEYEQRSEDRWVKSVQSKQAYKPLPGCGDFTGRCGKCGSNNLWDDNLHYGCNACGAVFLSNY